MAEPMKQTVAAILKSIERLVHLINSYVNIGYDSSLKI